jgi:hypothetical protein
LQVLAVAALAVAAVSFIGTGRSRSGTLEPTRRASVVREP